MFFTFKEREREFNFKQIIHWEKIKICYISNIMYLINLILFQKIKINSSVHYICKFINEGIINCLYKYNTIVFLFQTHTILNFNYNCHTTTQILSSTNFKISKLNIFSFIISVLFTFNRGSTKSPKGEIRDIIW